MSGALPLALHWPVYVAFPDVVGVAPAPLLPPVWGDAPAGVDPLAAEDEDWPPEGLDPDEPLPVDEEPVFALLPFEELLLDEPDWLPCEPLLFEAPAAGWAEDGESALPALVSCWEP